MARGISKFDNVASMVITADNDGNDWAPLLIQREGPGLVGGPDADDTPTTESGRGRIRAGYKYGCRD